MQVKTVLVRVKTAMGEKDLAVAATTVYKNRIRFIPSALHLGEISFIINYYYKVQ